MTSAPIVRAFFATMLAASVLLPLAPSPALAQSVQPVLVRNVTTNADAYAGGEVVRGTFELANPTAASVANLKYVVRLVGGYGTTTIWTTEYVADTSDAFTLNAREVAKIPFELMLPQGLAGDDFAIEAQALYGNGFPLAWEEKHITISGTSSFLTTQRAYVAIGEATFDVGEGPTLHEGQEGTLVASVRNETGAALTLTPSITYKTMPGAVVQTLQGKTFTIASGATLDVSEPISRTGLAAGVYTAEMKLLDASGNPHAVLLTYRFIIGGDNIATIQTASADVESVRAGETITVDVSFAGTPPDINPVGEVPESTGEATLTVELFNESDTSIGTGSVSVTLGSETTKSVPVSVTGTARAVRSVITLSNESGTLATLDVPLSRTYSAVAEGSAFMYIVYGLVVLAILLALVGGWFMLQSRASRAMPSVEPVAPSGSKPGIILLALAAITLALAIGTFVYASGRSEPLALAQTAHAQYEYYWIPDIDYAALCAYYPEYCGGGGVATPTYGVYIDDAVLWEDYIREYLPQWFYSGGYYYVKNVTLYSDPRNGSYGNRPRYSTDITRSSYDAGKVYDGSLPILSIANMDTIHAYNRGVDSSPQVKTLFDRIPAGSNTASPVYHSSVGFLGADSRAPDISLNPLNLPLTPGEEFYLEGTVAYQECLNIPAGFVIQGTFEGDERTATTDYNSSYQHAFIAANKRFSLGPFTAPSAPGIYRLDLGFGWNFNYTPLGSSREGHIEINVEGPTASLSASPTTVVPGNLSTLTSSCTDATSASIDQGVGSVDAAAADTSAVYPNANTTYTLTCTNASGISATAQASVAVSSECSDGDDNDGDGKRDYNGTLGVGDAGCNSSNDNSESPDPQPAAPAGGAEAYIEALPSRVNANGSATLSWSAENVTSCQVTGTNGFSRALTADASFLIATSTAASGTITTQTTFTISCTPTATHSDIVNIVVDVEEF